jgi:hypothetical protein
LSKSEKRYFRQYAERHTIGSKNNYLELFDAIQQQEVYDELALKVQLKNRSYSAYFAVAKQYLYQQLMESLHLFHQTNSIREKIKKHFHFCEILLQKGLLDQGRSTLEKAYKWINSYQLLEYIPMFITLQRRLIWSSENIDIDGLEGAHDTLEIALIQLKEMNWYWQQNARVVTLHYKKVQLENKKEQERLDEVVEILEKKGVPEQLQTRLGYYKTLATAAFMSGQKKRAYDYNKLAIDLFEEHPKLLELEPQMYVGNFNNFLIDNFLMKNYQVVEDGIERLRKLPQMKIFKPFIKLEVKIFELTYTLQLNTRIVQNKFDAALELIPVLEQKLKQHQENISINYKLQFYYLMAYILFRNKRYNKTLDALLIIREPKYFKVLEELMIIVDWLYLITHYELGNYLLLEHTIITIRRRHLKKLRFQKLEERLFKYLKKMSNPVLSRTEKHQLSEEFKISLQQLKKDPKEQRAWVYFNFDNWIETYLG